LAPEGGFEVEVGETIHPAVTKANGPGAQSFLPRRLVENAGTSLGHIKLPLDLFLAAG
jgi:hypothetical protein